MGQSTPNITVIKSESLQSSTHQDTSVLRSEVAAAPLQRHACLSLNDHRGTTACLQQENHEARLQLAVLPGSSLDASPAAQAQPQSDNNKVLELLQTRFASGCKLSTEASQEARQDLVSLLTDPM